jgi:hypothetical protein
MPFEIGERYSRDDIYVELGGSLQTYLPTVDGRVVCGCFDPVDINPNAPEEIFFGLPHEAPRVSEAADMVFRQGQEGDAIPVFLKRHVNQWEYFGDYLCIGITRDARVVRRKMDAYPSRGKFEGVLRFERV